MSSPTQCEIDRHSGLDCLPSPNVRLVYEPTVGAMGANIAGRQIVLQGPS